MGIDLDEARVARREKSKIHPELTFGGKTFALPVELPLRAVREMSKLSKLTKEKRGAEVTDVLLTTMAELLGDEFENFMDNHPSVNDMAALVEGIPGEYGMKLGESRGLDKPSKSSGAPRKRPSKPRTGSTSETPSGDPTPSEPAASGV